MGSEAVVLTRCPHCGTASDRPLVEGRSCAPCGWKFYTANGLTMLRAHRLNLEEFEAAARAHFEDSAAAVRSIVNEISFAEKCIAILEKSRGR